MAQTADHSGDGEGGERRGSALCWGCINSPAHLQVQLAVSFGELSVDDFAALEHRCWGTLLRHCLRASAQSRARAGLFVDSTTGAAAVVSAVRACHTATGSTACDLSACFCRAASAALSLALSGVPRC